jgi:quinol monooxygenase YgiN
MIVIRVLLNIKPEEKPEFLSHVQESIAISRQFEGCSAFSVYEDIQQENAFLLYEEWDSQQNFDAYKASEHFQETGRVLFPMMSGDPSSAYFNAEALPA